MLKMFRKLPMSTLKNVIQNYIALIHGVNIHYTTADLATIVQRSIIGQYVFSFVKNENTIVACPFPENVKISTDGLTWTPATTNLTSKEFNASTYGGGLFVIGNRSGQIYTSPDGLVWTLRTTPFAGSSDIRGLAYGNGRFVASSLDGKVCTSTDGITWTLVSAALEIGKLSYTNGMWFGGGPGNRYNWTSDDGLTWVNRGYYIAGHKEVIWTGSKFFTVTENGDIATSTNGLAWTKPFSCGDSMFCIAGKGDAIVAVGANGRLVTSIDNGLNWVSRKPYNNGLHSCIIK